MARRRISVSFASLRLGAAPARVAAASAPAGSVSRLRPEAPADLRWGFLIYKARWQSGHAAACKAVYAGSIPTLASRTSFADIRLRAEVGENLQKNPEK